MLILELKVLSFTKKNAPLKEKKNLRENALKWEKCVSEMALL